MSDKYTLMRQHYRKKSDDTAGKSSLLRSWGDKDPLKRPSCALLVTLAQAILRHADAHTLTKMVSSRRGGCLHELSHTHTHTHTSRLSHCKQTVNSPACNPQSVTPLVLTPILPINPLVPYLWLQTPWYSDMHSGCMVCSSVCCFVVQMLLVIAA